jgi:hypothetical protein
VGLFGAYYFGRLSAEIPPNVRSEFRRVLSLYSALVRFRDVIAWRGGILTEVSRGNGGVVSMTDVQASLDLLSIQVTEQIQTANDAVEGWRDLAPTEVEELDRRRQEQAQEFQDE